MIECGPLAEASYSMVKILPVSIVRTLIANLAMCEP